MRTRSPFSNTRPGSTRTASPFESRENNVRPIPRRGTLTGFESPVFTVVPVVSFDPVEAVAPSVVFSTGVFADVVVALGRFLLGLVDLVFAFFSFGREVRNAPRTSSPSCGGTATAKAAHMKTKPKRIALNRITKSPSPRAHPGA